MVSAYEIHGCELYELRHKRPQRRELPPGLALVQEVAREGDDIRLLLFHGLDEPGVVLPELRAVQVAELDYFEAVEAPGQVFKLQREARDGKAVLREQEQRGRDGDEHEQDGDDDTPALCHCASWSRM